tara:strand:+ start:333 stop:683 length:351 start_codon:yes stop_codon:yes gene_type:complete
MSTYESFSFNKSFDLNIIEGFDEQIKQIDKIEKRFDRFEKQKEDIENTSRNIKFLVEDYNEIKDNRHYTKYNHSRHNKTLADEMKQNNHDLNQSSKEVYILGTVTIVSLLLLAANL